MDDGRGQLAGDLEHLGQHQQQALAGGEGGGHRAAQHGTVQCAGRPGLTLHLDHFRHHTPQVGAAAGAPLVGVLTHCRGWSDRIDGDDFREQVRHAGYGFVGIDHLPAQHGCSGLIGHTLTVRSTRSR